MNGTWLAIGTAVLSFFGAILGSFITGYLVESHRQKNRLQLAAIDKRLEAYQEGYRRVVEIGIRISKRDKELPEMRSEAMQWLKGHYLYLGVEIGQKLYEAFNSDDEKQIDAAFEALEQAAGLPSFGEGRRPFV